MEPASRRIPELDGVRGFAAILVVLFHAFPTVFFWGWSGVDLFFVLSGYLITTIVVDRTGSPFFLQSFYVRRVTRIWPVYYLTLAVVLLVNAHSTTGYPTAGLLDHVFFIQNRQEYLGRAATPFIHPFAPSWSVALEEQFYLVWPVLIGTLGRGSTPFLALGFLGVSVPGRFFFPHSIDLLATRGDGLAFGCLLAWLLNKQSGVPYKWLVKLFSFAGAIGAVFAVTYMIVFWRDPTPRWTTFSFTGFSLLFFGVIGSSVLWTGSWFLRPLSNGILRWFGKISYAMYLFHLPLLIYTGTFLERFHVHSHKVQLLITWLLIVLLPALSWYLLEAPLLRFSQKWIARRSHQAVVATA